MLGVTKQEAELLYKYADKELYLQQEGGTLCDLFYVVCPCCGYHAIDEESSEEDNLEKLIEHSDNCEFIQYKSVLEKLNTFISNS